MVAKSFDGRIDTVVTNGVCWGTRSTLVATMSDFQELELLGSGQNADLTNDQADALWPLVSIASDLLALLVPSSFARDTPDNVGE
jgi:hypothetical protein